MTGKKGRAVTIQQLMAHKAHRGEETSTDKKPHCKSLYSRNE